jgi:hypothetical protein
MRILPLLALSVGCAWVGPKDVAEQLTHVDDDRDGVPASADCDDTDDRRFPGAVDAPYDGLDADCQMDDDFDVDQDGFVPNEYDGRTTAGVVEATQLPAGDCDDFDATVNPSGVDAWYDGVDTNCDGADDYDQDADHFVEEVYSGLPTVYVDDSGSLPVGDCDDAAAGVNPLAGDDWYDGIDSNCDGADDFDQDGDGFVADAHEGDTTEYVPGSGSLPAGDCNDGNPEYYPGAPDTWYDGLDNDCVGDDDYDQDLDGFDDPSGGGDDCDDLTPTTFPGQLETIGDIVDADCDGGIDSFTLAPAGGCTWVTPRSPTFVANSTTVFLSVSATELDCGTHYYDSAVALRYDAADPYAGAQAVDPWISSTTDHASFSIGAGHSVMVDDDYLYGLVGADVSSGRGMLLVRYPLAGGVADTVSLQDTAHDDNFADVSLAMSEDGTLGALGCEAVGGNLFYAKVSDIATHTPDFYTTSPSIWATSCALGASAGRERVYTVEATETIRRDYTDLGDDLSIGTPVTFVPGTITDMDWDGGATVYLANRTNNDGEARAADDASSIALDDGRGPIAMDVKVLSGTTWYGLVDATGRAWLGYGRASRGLTFFELNPGFNATDVTVQPVDGFILYAVSGGDQVYEGVAATT